jgi:surface antigen
MCLGAALIGGTAAIVLAITHNTQAQHLSAAEVSLGSGPVTPNGANQISITDLPTSAGKGGDPGDDYPWKNLAMDSKFDPWREYVRECTSFVAWALHSRNGFEMPFYGDASTWGPQARARGFVVNSSPAPGSVAWENGGDHVAWVSSVNGTSFTIEEYNEHYNGTYDSRTLNSNGKFLFIHFKDLPTVSAPVSAPPISSPAKAPPVASAPTVEGSKPTSSGAPATGSAPNAAGSTALGGGGAVSNPSQPSATPTPSPTPTPAPPPAAPQTFSETPGGVTHTWTDYSNAGGNQGPSISTSQTVQIACKVSGFRVADGDTWWYRIASSPWNGSYYASADAFYNDGSTSGSLIGTPYIDPSVSNC